MIVNVKDGVVSMPLSDLLRQCSGPDLKDVIDSIACEEEVITQVMNQVLDGFTELGSSAAKDYPEQPEPWSPIDQARRRIAQSADKVANEVIADLQEALKLSNEELAKLKAEHQSLCEKLKNRMMGQ